MKQLAGSIRIGWVIEYKGKPWTITKAQHIKPGKGGAFMQVEMKSVEEGTKTNERYRTEDTVEKMMVEDKDCQFLFEDGTGLNFMESETFEQFSPFLFGNAYSCVCYGNFQTFLMLVHYG